MVEQTSGGLIHVVDALKSSPLPSSAALPSTASHSAPSSLVSPLTLSQALHLREAVRRRERTLLRTHEAAVEELKRAQQRMQHWQLYGDASHRATEEQRGEVGGWAGGRQRGATVEWEEDEMAGEEQWAEEQAGEHGWRDDDRRDVAAGARVRVPSTLEAYWYERRDVGFRGQLRCYKQTMEELDRCYYQRQHYPYMETAR